jgi:hypothetical protein
MVNHESGTLIHKKFNLAHLPSCRVSSWGCPDWAALAHVPGCTMGIRFSQSDYRLFIYKDKELVLMFYATATKKTKDGIKSFINSELPTNRAAAEQEARNWAAAKGYTLDGVYRFKNV